MATTYKKLSYDGKPTMCDVAEKDSAGHTIKDYYVSKSGDTFSKGAMFYFPDSGNWNNSNSGVTFPYSCGGFQWTDQSDGIKLYGEATANDNLDLVLRFTDDNSNKFSIRNSINSQTSYITAAGAGYFSDLYRNNKQVVTTDDSRLSDARKNPKSISFKNASGNTVLYSGSDEVNLTGGVFYATSAGSATSATSATTATNLANTPSLLTNSSNQIAVKAGEKTSSYITVPYATSAGNVNNGTLTIQKNNSTIGSFGANQSTNATVNITVPTKTSELSNDSDYTTLNDGIPLIAGSNITLTETSNGLQINAASSSVSLMSTSTIGGAKLWAGTLQPISPTSTHSQSNRTYAAQLNSSQQLVVNVPWFTTRLNENNYTSYTSNTTATPKLLGSLYGGEYGLIVMFMYGASSNWAHISAHTTSSYISSKYFEDYLYAYSSVVTFFVPAFTYYYLYGSYLSWAGARYARLTPYYPYV